MWKQEVAARLLPPLLAVLMVIDSHNDSIVSHIRRGNLSFSCDKLMVGTQEALVVVTGSDPPQCNGAPPVTLPPPPAGPTFPQPTVWIISSFNQTVKVNAKAIVALGMVMQGQNGAPWPGMMLPGSGPAS